MGKYLEDKELDSVLEAYFNETEMTVFQESIIGKFKNMFRNKIENSKKAIGIECYDCLDYKVNVGKEYYYGTTILRTKSDAISKCLIVDMKLGTKDKDKLYINKKYEKELDSIKVYLYKVKITKVAEYYTPSKDCKVLEVEELTLRKALSYVNYELKDYSSVANKRKQVFSKVCSIVKKVFNEIGKDKLNGGFKISNYKEEYGQEQVEQFFNCIQDNFPIFYYDAWEFTNNKARDEGEFEKFNDVLIELMSKIKEELNKANIKGDIDSFGDWDDGDIDFVYKE